MWLSSARGWLDWTLVASICPLLLRFVPCWLGFVCDFPRGFLTCGTMRAFEWARVPCSLSAFLVPLLLLVGCSKLPLPHAMHGTWGCEGRLARGWRGGRGSVRAGGAWLVKRSLSTLLALCPFVPLFLLVNTPRNLFHVLCTGTGVVRCAMTSWGWSGRGGSV